MDFSGKGVGYVACNPINVTYSLAAMRCDMKGGPHEFTTKGFKLVLCCVAFGSCCTRGNEKCLHFHLGDEFSDDW